MYKTLITTVVCSTIKNHARFQALNIKIHGILLDLTPNHVNMSLERVHKKWFITPYHKHLSLTFDDSLFTTLLFHDAMFTVQQLARWEGVSCITQ